MNVKKCYEIMNGDYEDVKSRFLTDARIRRFALLFLRDGSMEDNLGFTGLYAPVMRITEMLREGDFDSAAAEMPGVEKAYESTVRGLCELEQL